MITKLRGLRSGLRKARLRIGHRGAFLIFLFILDELYAYSLYADPPRGVHWYIPPNIWAVIWASVGVILLTGLISRADKLQFSLAAGLKVAWGATWVRIWLFDPVPRAWINAAIWLSFAAMVVIISWWSEPPLYQRQDLKNREADFGRDVLARSRAYDKENDKRSDKDRE